MNVNPATRDEQGNTFLHYAAMYNRDKVVKMFCNKIGPEEKNKSGDTPLHISTSKGHHETVLAFFEENAKFNIKNSHEVNVLHVAACSKDIKSETVVKLFQHARETDDSESVNAEDNEQNNPLHLAVKFAKTDVIWEFRHVSLKGKNCKGNTPLHLAVRPGEPEVLDMMLNIYKNISPDAVINTQNTERKKGVLHLAALEGCTQGIRRLLLCGADLALQDNEGNTVLHTLTKASVNDHDRANQHIETFDFITEEAVRWWCKREKKEFPNNEGLHTEYKRKAVLRFIRDYTNKAGFSVLGVDFVTGSAEIVKKLLHMKNVMCFDKDQTCDLDITTLTPLTNGYNARLCGFNQIKPQISCMEGLFHLGSPDTLERTLEIPPVRQIEQGYSIFVSWTYRILLMLHLMYMFVVSGFSFYLSERRRTSPSDPPLDLPTYIICFILASEPMLIHFNTVYKSLIYLCEILQHKSALAKFFQWKTFRSSLRFLFSSIYANILLLWMLVYMFVSCPHEYILTPALVLGWLLTITFTRGIKGIHCFWRTFRDLIFQDVCQFFIIYFIVLLAFSIGVHNLFQVEPDIAKQYPSLLDTMYLFFNLMVGMRELNIESAGKITLYIKIFYIIYIFIGMIVLINFFISMMNDSYSKIFHRQEYAWRVESLELGLEIEKFYPQYRQLCCKRLRRIQKEEDSWIIKISQKDMKTDQMTFEGIKNTNS
ncbi:transient receptor potential cation channel subfamily V member 1-like isoform X1 [Gigantopelta aegis]|uniref:transient receptor potential cation channel subfamily V member 1-like isoform X1 n=1 Tax=Gigantopelta aegis TaxID=1735272 RepID=UPI001B88DA50|nr:transient receptor potential cation channel subfamily V member 1-like isoform X1 [Gigantopelta aegis]